MTTPAFVRSLDDGVAELQIGIIDPFILSLDNERQIDVLQTALEEARGIVLRVGGDERRKECER
jgi:hypothetical protein